MLARNFAGYDVTSVAISLARLRISISVSVTSAPRIEWSSVWYGLIRKAYQRWFEARTSSSNVERVWMTELTFKRTLLGSINGSMTSIGRPMSAGTKWNNFSADDV